MSKDGEKRKGEKPATSTFGQMAKKIRNNPGTFVVSVLALAVITVSIPLAGPFIAAGLIGGFVVQCRSDAKEAREQIERDDMSKIQTGGDRNQGRGVGPGQQQKLEKDRAKPAKQGAVLLTTPAPSSGSLSPPSTPRVQSRPGGGSKSLGG